MGSSKQQLTSGYRVCGAEEEGSKPESFVCSFVPGDAGGRAGGASEGRCDLQSA